ncbi:hypothetical protein BKI52_13085 [marine bacterium AO1-C]|nr:hypothetical protein BKI52_13085 [marine bacterium AO1-C]
MDVDAPPKAQQASQGEPTRANNTLKRSAKVWFIVAVIGQLMFAVYVAGFYWLSALQGNFAKWEKATPKGFVEGDVMGNTAMIMHMLLALIIIVGGPLQFVPHIQRKYRKFHRWNGRVYMITVFLVSGTGLYMVWAKGGIGGPFQYAASTLNTILIFWFGILTWRTAVQRKLKVHKRWAFRLFLAGSGVWFARLGFMSWVMTHVTLGYDYNTYWPHFYNIWSFGQFVVPLLAFELYWRTLEKSSKTRKYAFTGLLYFLTLLTAIGIISVTIAMWIPRLTG